MINFKANIKSIRTCIDSGKISVSFDGSAHYKIFHDNIYTVNQRVRNLPHTLAITNSMSGINKYLTMVEANHLIPKTQNKAFMLLGHVSQDSEYNVEEHISIEFFIAPISFDKFYQSILSEVYKDHVLEISFFEFEGFTNQENKDYALSHKVEEETSIRIPPQEPFIETRGKGHFFCSPAEETTINFLQEKTVA